MSHEHTSAEFFVTPSIDVEDVFKFKRIQVSEVISLLSNLDIKKSTGPDGISALFLQQVAEEVATPLTFLYNKSLESGLVPMAWKKSNVTPVHKGGKTDDPGNYRPISVVPIVAKVFEKMIASQLNIFLEHHHLLHTLQGAYRHGRSADQILMYAVDTIVQAVDAGDCVCAAFLDLRKEFDSLDHCILLGRLPKLGVTGVELRWLTDYLSGRMQRVKQNDRYSDWGLVLGGIPQGSALGPLLFLIYVNEMPSQVRHGCLLQFADDTCLICAGNSPGVVARLLQDDLSVLSNWVALSKMKLNFNKSNVMWFNVKRLATSPPPILLNSVPLSSVQKQKYLGVTFDTNLNWSSHVAGVCRSMSYYLHLINCHVKSLPSDIIKMLVESLVFSRYTYALSVWGPAIHQDSLSRISRLQNRAVRMTCNLRKYDRISHHRGNLRWLSISSFIRYRSMLTMFDNYYLEKGVALEPPILFGVQHSYRTRRPKYFAAIPRCRLSFTKRFFRCQAIHWWNALPSAFFHDITTFSSNLFRHLLDFT